MDKSKELIIAVITQMFIYGPQAVLAAIAAFKKDVWTADEIRALNIDKKPEDFFNEE